MLAGLLVPSSPSGPVRSVAGAAAAWAQPAVVGQRPIGAEVDVEVAADATVRYQPPVDGAVRQAFRAPTSAYGPGHRGVDLAARPGTEVRAAADGVVSHAGAVAGVVWVSVAHRDGIVTSYGPLGPPLVRRGEVVRRGQVLARLAAGGHGDGGADEGLHWGARRHGVYLDPMTLLDQGVPRPSLVGAGAWRGTAHAVTTYEPWAGGSRRGWTVAPSPPATAAGYAVAPSPNHLVTVAGLATTSSAQVIDPTHLGYDLASVTRLSYAGRTEAVGDAGDPLRDQAVYGPQDTWAGAGPAAARLAAQLRAQAAREPGRAVDLLGHSMGGVVILRYLVEHHDAYDRSLPPIGSVVLIASPLDGSDLAAVGRDLRGHGLLGPLAEAGRRVVADGDGRFARDAAGLALDAPAIDELASGSRRTIELGRAWDEALRSGPAGPLATGTRVLTIAGSRDRVVGADRASLPDPWATGVPPASPEVIRAARVAKRDGRDARDAPVLEHRVLPGDHGSVLDSEAVRETVYRFLSGEEVVDSDGRLATLTAREVGAASRVGMAWLRTRDLLAGPVRALLRRPVPTVPGG